MSQDLLVFRRARWADRRGRRGLHFLIFDNTGNETGGVVDARPRFSLRRLLERRLAVYGHDDTKVIELVKSNWGVLRLPPTKVVEGTGATAGSIVPRDFSRKRFALERSPRGAAGGLEWQWSNDRDVKWVVVATDDVGGTLGQIVYQKKRFAARSHSLTIARDCNRDLRLLLLGSAAAVDDVIRFGEPVNDGSA